jgi:antirestriction protein ArdC
VLTEHERDARRAAQRELADQAVEALRSSSGWQQWLSTRRRFHHYSLGNQLLISLQAPDAKRVAGFHAWLQLGYCVRKGEHAIKIWMPIAPTSKQLRAWRDAGADPADKPRTLFKLGSVFDVAQVDPLPPPATPHPLEPPSAPIEGSELAHLQQPLEDFAQTLGYSVTIEPLNGPEGVCSHRAHTISVDAALEVNGRIAALIHELAHALVKVDRGDGDPQLSYAAEELVVESVAYSVTAAAGLDTSANTIPYLTSWSQTTPIATIHAHAQLIDRLARRIEDTIEALAVNVQRDNSEPERACAERPDAHARNRDAPYELDSPGGWER